jgi:hypothetical protein
MKKTKIGKLVVNRETIRTLVASELERAAGGNVNGHSTPMVTCSTNGLDKCNYMSNASICGCF